MENNTGKTFTGIVTSDKMNNTIVVTLSYTFRHPKYKKIVKKNKKIYSENNLSAKTGDTVTVRETRPLSKLKRFTTVTIVKKGVEVDQI
ncbi:30S ribosomal protein S17 [Candidatus Shapirobacteria bacterium]|nr:30S ribosomal protein S17 [Candidatus Shapirobacteria bacterium]